MLKIMRLPISLFTKTVLSPLLHLCKQPNIDGLAFSSKNIPDPHPFSG